MYVFKKQGLIRPTPRVATALQISEAADPWAESIDSSLPPVKIAPIRRIGLV